MTKDEKEMLTRGIQGELENFDLIIQSTDAIGCVPFILNPQVTANESPDDRTIIVYLAYLCSRLLSLKAERYFHFLFRNFVISFFYDIYLVGILFYLFLYDIFTN